jgi:hypothetical protein
VGGVGNDRCATGEVAGDGLPGGEGDVGSKTQPEDPLGRLAPVLAVVVRVAHVAAGGDEPVVGAGWLRGRGERDEHTAGGGGVWTPARGRSAGGAGGEAGDAEAHLRGWRCRARFDLSGLSWSIGSGRCCHNYEAENFFLF